MLQGTVAIPYNDSMVDAIDQACRSYKNKDSYCLMEEMVECFLFNKIPEDFKLHLGTVLKIKMLPENVIKKIAQYLCYTIVMEESNALRQSILATIFMNYLFAIKGDLNKLEHANLIVKLYNYHLSHYIESIDQVGTDENTPIVEDIAISDNVIESLEDKDAANEQLKVIAKQAAFYRYGKILEGRDIQSIDDSYLRIYRGLTTLVNSMDYLYYNYSVMEAVKKLLKGNEFNKRKKLSSIVASISNDNELKYNTSSSVLLRLIDGEDISSAKETLLPIKEFAVYLYFELLLERVIQNEFE